MKLSTISPALVGASILFSLSTHAALTAVDLDGNATNGLEGVYDSVLDITWLADANLAESNTFGVGGVNNRGAMAWNTAETFIGAMNADNAGVGYLGVNTWRQSTVAPLNGIAFDTIHTYDGSSDQSHQLSAPVDATYNPNGQSPGFTGSELAYHYYNNFGAIGSCYGSGTSFTGCQTSTVSGIDDAPDTDGNKALFSYIYNSYYWAGTELDSSSAFHFRTVVGFQSYALKSRNSYVWPVADGNVAASAVPIPAAAWLFGSALAGLIGLRRFK